MKDVGADLVSSLCDYVGLAASFGPRGMRGKSKRLEHRLGLEA